MAGDDILEVGKVLADVSNELAMEVLAEYSDEEYVANTETIDHLRRASDVLLKIGMQVPPMVTNVLDNAAVAVASETKALKA